MELLGAHVSAQGGVQNAPARAKAIGATVLQLFTKTPNQWREPGVDQETSVAFRQEMDRTGMRLAVAHDSYLINLASPDPVLSARSIKSFTAELIRCETLGIPYLVSHPGNYMDDRKLGLARNAASYARCLAEVPGKVMVLLETTAGSGTALGRSFEELAYFKKLVVEIIPTFKDSASWRGRASPIRSGRMPDRILFWTTVISRHALCAEKSF